MTSNNILNTLHFERIARLNKKEPEQKSKQKPEPEFSCAVCYTNGDTSGLVIPASCSHKICLACYTTIVLEHKDRAKCPECRTTYKKGSAAADDEYADMPPLISQLEINDYYRRQNNLIEMTRLDNLINQLFVIN